MPVNRHSGGPGKSCPGAQRLQTQNHHCLLGDSGPTCGTLAARTGLSLAGLSLPPLKPVLGMSGNPALRRRSRP